MRAAPRLEHPGRRSERGRDRRIAGLGLGGVERLAVALGVDLADRLDGIHVVAAARLLGAEQHEP
jgi:hypothetical protein